MHCVACGRVDIPQGKKTHPTRLTLQRVDLRFSIMFSFFYFHDASFHFGIEHLALKERFFYQTVER